MPDTIQYKSGYKYQLVTSYEITIPILPELEIDILFVRLSTSGKLDILYGYAWDGPSGITFDTKNFMRGSLVHDVLYQLMRMSLLSRVHYKGPADRLLQSMCIEDGMSKFRAWYVYMGVSKFGGASTLDANIKKTLYAP